MLAIGTTAVVLAKVNLGAGPDLEYAVALSSLHPRQVMRQR